jgi:hypothetical protein
MKSNSKPIEYINGKTVVKLILPEASFPSKEEGRQSSVGFDLELVQRCDNRAEDSTHEVNTFRTGVCVSPPTGYYIELVAKNTLYKNGYFLAGGSVIVEPWNSGEIIVPLYKYKEVDDIELPFQAVQFVIKPIIYSYLSFMSSTPDEGGGSSINKERNIEYIQDPQLSYKAQKSSTRTKNHMF